MGENSFYIVYLKGLPIHKVLFHTLKIEFWAEPENQKELKERFRKSSQWGRYEVLAIEPIELPYDDVVIG